ncbi:MAG: CPBP family intramembrane metalloprotease [Bacteroidetes bacterium]|nr:CPBP family intramembrane metalloprotease [Bacteroidota bacterium]
MHKIAGYLGNYLHEDFELRLYLKEALFLVVLVSINYTFDLEDGIIDAWVGNPIRIVWYFLLYATAYYGALLIWARHTGQMAVFRSRRVWQYSLFGLAVLAWDGGFYGYQPLSKVLFGGQIYEFAFYALSNLSSLLTVFLPLTVFYLTVDRQRSRFYGLFKPQSVAPYLLLLAAMLPLIAWASFQPDFLRAYPSYRDSSANEFFGVAPWVTALAFELFYGFDFVSTELLFRGFMIIGMAQLLGRGTLLPMVVCYASLHFGKPLGETIGSVFGGYILGVIALRSQSVWGGILVHVGIAWAMELAAWLQLAR